MPGLALILAVAGLAPTVATAAASDKPATAGASSKAAEANAAGTADTAAAKPTAATAAAPTRTASSSVKAGRSGAPSKTPGTTVAARAPVKPAATPAADARGAGSGKSPAADVAPAKPAAVVASIAPAKLAVILPAAAIASAAAQSIDDLAQFAAVVAAQCLATRPASEPATLALPPDETVEIASSDPQAVLVADAGDQPPAPVAAAPAPAAAPPGPGIVPPDVLAFAVRAHALFPVVPVSVALAQWAKESAWSVSVPPNSNNPFGIKCYDPGKGCSTSKTAEQDKKGKQSIISAQFQAFPSIADAFMNYARILATLGVYEAARNSSDIDGFAKGLAAYATDRDYTASLIRDYLRPYDLYKYDDCDVAFAGWVPSNS
jgi:flagellum-specific peptidoglycan hydrolase FlgJ